MKLDLPLKVINEQTGETYDLLAIGREERIKKVRRDKGFVKVFITFLSDVVENKEIAGKSIRLLMYILENLDYNDLRVYLEPKQVMEDLKITKMTYYNWLKTLIKEGYIERVGTNLYQLKPYSGVKGSMSEVIFG